MNWSSRKVDEFFEKGVGAFKEVWVRVSGFSLLVPSALEAHLSHHSSPSTAVPSCAPSPTPQSDLNSITSALKLRPPTPASYPTSFDPKIPL